MKVIQRLRLNSVVTACSVLLILVVFIVAVYRVHVALESAKTANDIMTSSFERLILRTDSHRTGNERTKIQLIAKHKQIGELLNSALSKFTDPEDTQTIRELLAIHESIGKLSRTIRENREKAEARPNALFPELEDRLLSQLNMRVYETILLDSKLQESSKKAVRSALIQAAGGILFMLLLVSMTILINSWAMGRMIANRIGKLQDGAAVIGEGNLDHLIDIQGQDEFTGLSQSFNVMTVKLRSSYHDLEKQIEERKRVEEELRRARDELDLRVQKRTEELATTVETLLEEIANRERAEGSIQRLNRLYAVLSETDQAIIRVSDRDTLFRDFCRIAVDQGGFLLAWVGLVDNASGTLNIVTSYGATGYLDGIRITTGDEPTGAGPTGIAIRKGTYCICNDFQNDPCTFPWHEQGRTYGICASASVALKEDDRVIGALTLYAGIRDFFDHQHVALLQQMGADISFALGNLTREAHRRATELALREESLERLRTLEALREKEQLLIHQSRQAAMGEMINNIAHQWRQPLNLVGLIMQELPLLSATGDLSDEYLRARVAKAMGVINHMSRTIDDFRDFFKPDRGEIPFKVGEIITRTLSLVDENFKKDNIRVDVDIADNPVITGFPNEFSQVLLNILNNARDAFAGNSSSGQRILTIRLTAEQDRAVITITDNAGGISENHIDRIFDPYFTTKGPDKGTGVGLFMARTIITRNMNGTLSARNTGDGAEFRIEV
jgi:signal transduction histidine kinase/HAMP domain-containing protein